MLLEIDDTIINTDHIRSAVRLPVVEGRPARTRVTFADGTTDCLDCDLDRLTNVSGAIVPAAPGYRVIRGYYDKGEDPECLFDEHPIIAFRITGGEECPPTPVSLDYASHYDDVVITPDGACFSLDGQRNWDNVEEFKRSFVARQTQNLQTQRLHRAEP